MRDIPATTRTGRRISQEQEPLLTRNFQSGMWHDVKIPSLMLSALKIESPEAKWGLWSGSIGINFWMHKGMEYSRTSASLLQSSRWCESSCSSPISLQLGKRASKEKHHLADLKDLFDLSQLISSGWNKAGFKTGLNS